MKTSTRSKVISDNEDLLLKTMQRLQALKLSRKAKVAAATKRPIKDDFHLFPCPKQRHDSSVAVFGLPPLSKYTIDAYVALPKIRSPS